MKWVSHVLFHKVKDTCNLAFWHLFTFAMCEWVGEISCFLLNRMVKHILQNMGHLSILYLEAAFVSNEKKILHWVVEDSNQWHTLTLLWNKNTFLFYSLYVNSNVGISIEWKKMEYIIRMFFFIITTHSEVSSVVNFSWKTPSI